MAFQAHSSVHNFQLDNLAAQKNYLLEGQTNGDRLVARPVSASAINIAGHL